MTGDQLDLDSLGECIVCDKRLVPNAVWSGATQEQRDTWKGQGLARGCRIDMCNTCRMRLTRQGRLDQYPTTVLSKPADVDTINPWTCCRRCGHDELHTGVLCHDCVEYAARAGETHRWVA